MQSFPFIQFEFTSSLGPPTGRYLVIPPPADEDPHADPSSPDAVPFDPGEKQLKEINEQLADTGSADVLVIRTQGAPPAQRSRLRRAPREESSGQKPREIALTVATVVYGTHILRDSAAGDRLLKQLIDEEGAEEWVAEALRIINRAVGAYRLCSADPYIFDVSRGDPRTIRIGYGVAEEVYAGAWTRAVGILPPPAPKLSRAAKLMPSDGMSAVLARQMKTLESEELLLRVMLDLDQERPRAAALGLAAGFELLQYELAEQTLAPGVQKLMEDVIERQEPVDELAKRARRQALTRRQVQELRDHADAIGGLVDRWRYEPLGYA